MAPGDVESYMTFLSRDELYLHQKPYTTDFPVDDIKGAKMNNYIYDVRPVTFHDARLAEEPPTLDENGFCYIKAKTALKAEDATAETTELMSQYMKEVVNILLDKFPQYKEIKSMDFQVRKRDTAFPNEQRTAEFAQPSTMAHVDFSIRGAFLRMADVFPNQESEYENRSFDLINVWRVLQGPNNDWPLAVCDSQFVQPEEDITTNDALHHERIGENSLLHHSEAQRWYYLSDMSADDLLVFRNIDSESKMARGFHASFNNPHSLGGLRHSIEVRLVAFRD